LSIWFKGLSGQFVALVATILIVAMFANTYVQYRGDIDRHVTNLESRGDSIASLLAEISVEPLLTYDYVSLSGYTRDAGMQSHVVYVAVLGVNGQVFASHLNESNTIAKSALDSDPSKNSGGKIATIKDHNDLLHISLPISFEERELGQVLIGIDPTDAYMSGKEHLLIQLLVSSIIAVAVGVAMFVAFRRRILSRVHELVNSVDRMAKFDLDQHVSVSGHDELTKLASSFNHMAKKLKAAVRQKELAIEETEQLNENLEQRVAERSAELRTLNAELAYQAMHDALTRLPNRVLIVDRLQSAITQAKRNHSRTVVFLLDLDHFKDVNDTLGHPTGDILLKELGLRLPNALREGDTIGRLGGDEFAIVLPDTNEEGAWSVGRKLLEELKKPFSVHGHNLVIDASLGMAVFPDHGDDDATLLRRADVAMYAAKKGDERIAVYSPEVDTFSVERLALMADLRHAIESNELKLYYQPIVELKTGKVVRAEALARWNHPTKGMIPPDLFINMAESSGLIKPLTEWVVRAAINQLAIWESEGIDIRVSINLSVRNLLDPKLPERIKQLCKESVVPCDRLKCEITESDLMANPELVMDTLTHPDMEDIDISIDDFGTGYSSLSYLKRLPVQEVKIDRSFVTDMLKDNDDATIVRSTIELAHNLGLRVVAEGVEDMETMIQLQVLNCDFAQGYHFLQPVPAKELNSAISIIQDAAAPRFVIYK
jgi:diguanylate cyclase (GGDEF)-like protein